MRRVWIAAVVVALAAIVVAWRLRSRGGSASHGAGGKADAPLQYRDPEALPRAAVAGAVKDRRGKAIVGATVCAAAERRDPSCTTSDASGRYAIANLLATAYVVSASARSYRQAVYHPEGDRQRRRFWLAPGERRDGIDMVLDDGGVELT